MLIEQVIEFELRGPGPLKFKFNNTFTCTAHVLQQLVIFMKKQKSPRKILEWIIIYC